MLLFFSAVLPLLFTILNLVHLAVSRVDAVLLFLKTYVQEMRRKTFILFEEPLFC